MTRTRSKIVETNRPHFFTCTIVGWLPIFTRPETMDIVMDSWRYLQKERGLSRPGQRHRRLQVIHCESHHQVAQEKNAETILKQLRYFKLRHRKDR
jgi:hypothetical protein